MNGLIGNEDQLEQSRSESGERAVAKVRERERHGRRQRGHDTDTVVLVSCHKNQLHSLRYFLYSTSYGNRIKVNNFLKIIRSKKIKSVPDGLFHLRLVLAGRNHRYFYPFC